MEHPEASDDKVNFPNPGPMNALDLNDMHRNTGRGVW
jgi:hypothetical protein